jgi:hypothetical protein
MAIRFKLPPSGQHRAQCADESRAGSGALPDNDGKRARSVRSENNYGKYSL